MRTSHRKQRPTPKTPADRRAITLRKLVRRVGYPLPDGVTGCAYCHRTAGRDMDAGQSGELRQTAAGNWICSRHGREFASATPVSALEA